MSIPVTAFVCTRDDSLARAVTAYAAAQVNVGHLDHTARIEPLLEKSGWSLVFMDMRLPHAIDWIERIREARPAHLIVALGSLRSDPMREAKALGVYAAESADLEREHFQSLVSHALDHLKLQQEVDLLRETASATPPSTRHVRSERGGGDMPLHYFSHALRRFDDPAALVDSVVEGIAGTAKVTRAGIFSQTHKAGPYRLQSGLRCLEETRHVEFAEGHPLIRWLELQAHMVARSTLEHIPDASNRELLKQTLDALGAEILMPLFSRGRLTGWLFLGQRATGVPFSYDELEDINVVTEHIATTLENAKLYEEVALQKTLAETLFHSIPIGIAAVGTDGYVRWFNDAAERLLNLTTDSVMNQPVRVLGSRLADHLLRTSEGESVTGAREWKHPETHRYLSVQTHRLLDRGDHCMGAVALIHDMTQALQLRERQEQLDRAAFWTELAASMSHEIRNPLVAIKTFAQLLPQRFDDPDFRTEFSKMVAAEVGRLDSIIDQINSFANPAELDFREVNVSAIVQKAIEAAKTKHPQNGIMIEADIDPNLRPIVADASALNNAVTHLVLNAMESLPRKPDAQVKVVVQNMKLGVNGSGLNGGSTPGIRLTIADNGHGIDPEIKEKMFSPFCTTKARGMGLGLPIAKRTAIDHCGQIEIQSDNQGTRVTLQLPTTPTDTRHNHGETARGASESHT